MSNILIIEDNKYEAELIFRALKKCSTSVTVTHKKDGIEGIEYLETLCKADGIANELLPSVIIMDMNLPKITGLETLKIIRNNQSMNHIPVVIFTSAVQEEHVEEIYSAGANSIIVKPDDYQGFCDSLSRTANYWMGLNCARV
jgi:CheY-like chemotaxis protein